MTLTQTSRDHQTRDIQAEAIPTEPVSIDHNRRETQIASVDGTPFSADQMDNETHQVLVGAPLSTSAIGTSAPTARTLVRNSLFDGYLCLLSDMLDDLESVRIASQNRARSLTRTETDADGELRGLGMDARSPEVARALALVDQIELLENSATLDLKRALRTHPLYSFVKNAKGIGEKQGARLLAVIGDPYWNDLYDRPRTVSELWAYCGYSVISGRAQRRTKGVKSNWNDKAKSRAFLVAQQCVITGKGGKYNELYYSLKAKSAGAIHEFDCVRCGPSGKPALAGTPLSDGHRDARAKRAIAKEILKDLWIAAREIHTNGEHS